MGKKYFLIGNPSSIWMKEIIKEIHVQNDDDVYLTVFDNSRMEFKEEYKALGTKLVVLGKKNTKIEKIVKAFNLFRFAFKHRKKEKFNLVIIHCPPNNFQTYILEIAIKLMRTKAFLVFWGSDILSINTCEAKRLERLVKCSSGIGRMNENMEEAFIKNFGHIYDNRFSNMELLFGTLALPYIKNCMSVSSKNDCKKKLGIDGRTTIAVGYNGIEEQQHLKVLEQLEKLTDIEKKNIYLLVHLYGGRKEKYINAIKNRLELMNIPYLCIEKRLNFEEVSVLRGATDIFIHAQTSDALSSSIRESLLAEAILINPTWINYYEYKDLGIEYIEYDEFNELNDIVRKILNKEISINTVKNKNIIYKEYSWDKTRKDWIAAFEKCSD